MPEPTTPQLTESEVADLEHFAGNGTLQFPLRVEHWHKSLTDGGWFIRQSSGRIVMTVAFVPAEIESGIPAQDGNAPARTIVALLNSIPALIRDWRALRQWKAEALPLLTRYDNLAETFDGRLGSSKATNLEQGVAALREQLADARAEGERLAAQLKEWQEEKDTKADYL